MEEALELGREDHVHEDGAHPERERKAGRRLAHVARVGGPPDRIAARELEAIDDLLDIVHRIAERDALEVRGDLDLTLPIAPLDLRGSARLLETDEARAPHELAVRAR